MTYPWSSGDVLTAADLNAYAGLILVKTQTVGSGVSSVTVTDAFSSTFDNYCIVIQGNAASTTSSAELQLGVGGTMTTTGYYWGHLRVDMSGAVNGGGASNDSKLGEATVPTTTGASAVINITAPNKAVYTNIVSHGSDLRTTGNPFRSTQGFVASTTQFTSFKFAPGAGTLTGGTIRVYGYNNG